jgi:FkbM family methyltransferase
MSISIVSYAQNNEDVMLWRALGHLDKGFYIDVGAQDPLVDSVTKAFYESGWHGINIEPVKHWFERLEEDRPHDINLQVATSDRPGELTLFEVEDTGLSTTSPEFAERHRAQGFVVNRSVVPCVTLDDICRENHVGTVHFLKVDCEGAEKQTLEGISLTKVRPWIVLVEATEPNSQKTTHGEWEHLLVQRGYEFAYFDGLNRFYVATEHDSLRQAFATPPNVFDGVSRFEVLKVHARVDELSNQLAQMTAVERNAQSEAERDALRAEAERLNGELESARREVLVSHASMQVREARITELQAMYDQSLVGNGQLQNELGRMRGKLQEAYASNHARETRIAELQSSYDHSQTENGQLQKEIERTRRELQVAVQTSEARITELQATCDQSAAENGRLQDELGRTRRTWQETQASILACKAHITSLLAELQQTRAVRESSMPESKGETGASLDLLMAEVREDVRHSRASTSGAAGASGDEAMTSSGTSGAVTMEEVMARVRAEVARRREQQSMASIDAVPVAGVPQQPVRWHPAEPRLEPRQQYRLAELLRFDDIDFVDTAYRALLLRPADPVGRSHYLDALRGGNTSKVEILGAIRFSAEGRKCGVHVDGLLLPYKLHQWRHKRLLGPVLGFVMGVFRLHRLVFRLQGMEATAARESHAVGRALNGLDTEVRALRGELNQSILARVDALRALAAWIETVQQLAETHSRQSPPDEEVK